MWSLSKLQSIQRYYNLSTSAMPTKKLLRQFVGVMTFVCLAGSGTRIFFISLMERWCRILSRRTVSLIYASYGQYPPTDVRIHLVVVTVGKSGWGSQLVETRGKVQWSKIYTLFLIVGSGTKFHKMIWVAAVLIFKTDWKMKPVKSPGRILQAASYSLFLVMVPGAKCNKSLWKTESPRRNCIWFLKFM